MAIFDAKEWMKERTLYLDCSSGISGDMTVAALLDLGADEQGLRDTLSSLPLEGYEIRVSRVKKAGIDVCDFDVVLDAAHENHDHDMAYLHGDLRRALSVAGAGYDHPGEEHEHGQDHVHAHDEVHGHDQAHDEHHDHDHHEHDHDHDHHDHGHNHHDHGHGAHDHAHHGRNLDDIRAILYAGSLNDRALALALRIFEIVAEAESAVHGLPIEAVHFHEVGAVDSIIDIAAIAYCIDDLDIRRVIIPSLSEGTGMVRCQHGLLPIPVPATSAIAARYHLPLRVLPVEGELVTPTGAAAAAALMTDTVLPERFTIERIGMGAGKRDYAVAGILRAMLIETQEAPKEDEPQDNRQQEEGCTALWEQEARDSQEAPEAGAASAVYDRILKLEANLDDSSGETLGFVMERLLEAGALDVFYTPIYMKKNRPAAMLSVLCREQDREGLEALIFRHTTCIGVRYAVMHRSKLERESRTIETPLGDAKVKICFFKGEIYCYPEHESVAALSGESGLGYDEVYHAIKQFAMRRLS